MLSHTWHPQNGGHHRFCVVIPSLSFVPRHILLFLMICWLFIIMLFSLHVLVFLFFVFFFLIVFNSYSCYLILQCCVQKIFLTWFQFFKKLLRLELWAQDVIYPRKCFMCSWETIIKNHPSKESQGPNDFTGKFYQNFRNELTSIMLKLF